jgi:hypothetical protein
MGKTLTRLTIASLLGAAVLVGCAAKAPPARPSHRFELISSVWALDAKGNQVVGVEERCLFGRYESGLPVLLLPDAGSSACQVTTGRVGASENGECTVLAGIERCGGAYRLGVIGARGDYRRVEPQAVQDEATLRALGAAVAKGRAVEMASSRWRKVLRDGTSYDEAIRSAVAFPTLDGGPTLVQLRVNGEAIDGPWVAISGGEVGTLIGPYSMPPLLAFTLDGLSYIQLGVAGCSNCGAAGTEVHAVEAGKLRRVLESFANAN